MANRGQYGLPPGPASPPPHTWSGIYPGYILSNGYGGTGLNKDTVRAWALLWLPAETKIDACVVNVTTLDATGTVRMGLYDCDNRGWPRRLLVDAGLVSMASTGEKYATFSPITVKTGGIWMVLHQLGAAGAVASFSNSAVIYPTMGQPSTAPGTFATTMLRQTLTTDSSLPELAPPIRTLTPDRNGPTMSIRTAF